MLPESVLEWVGVEGVFFLRLSKKLTPLVIILEMFRFRFNPNKGLKKRLFSFTVKSSCRFDNL